LLNRKGAVFFVPWSLHPLCIRHKARPSTPAVLIPLVTRSSTVFFFCRSSMPRGIRRPPPSHLLLAPPGPVPRGKPKYNLPSIPLRTFQPAGQLPKATSKRMLHNQLPQLVTDFVMMTPSTETYSASWSSTSDSERSWPWSYQHHSASGSIPSLATFSSGSSSPSGGQLRGPWDYSPPVNIDVQSILAVPKPVAISP